jgi:sarcosine oxidase subunit gamma
MVERYLRQDPLAHRALKSAVPGADADAGRLSLRLLPERTQMALRGDAASNGFVAAVRQAAGVDLPVRANRAVRGTGADILWLGPDEWLVVGHGVDDTLQGRLQQALSGQHSLVSDVSSSRAILELRGAGARSVLARGCALDLHPRSFVADDVAQSLLARTHVLLHALDSTPTFHIYVHRSFCDYAYAWLLDAAAEFEPLLG